MLRLSKSAELYESHQADAKTSRALIAWVSIEGFNANVQW
jgi:hypothetical protein